MRLYRLLLGSGLTLVLSFSAFHCGQDETSATFPGGDGTGDGGDEGGGINFGTCDGSPCSTHPDAAASGPTCGDGRVGTKEGCDDGNTKSGDGCSATCNVEPGWACPTPGLRCQAAKCGDGIIAGVEECDYKGTPVAGCDPTTCRILPTYDCDPKTLTCNVVMCGDGKIQRGENCEDGNTLPFDGCFKCLKEPSCASGVCKASCGDGQRFASEACDDGNTRDGDGCSSTCTVETGFKCTDVLGAPPASIDQPVLVRDFVGYGRTLAGFTPHEDFNQLAGDGLLDIVEPNLKSTGRMKLNCPGGNCAMNPGHTFFGGAARPNISTEANFDQWYVNVAGVNLAQSITIPLARQPVTGNYLWDSADTTTNGGKDYFDPIGTGGWVAAGKESLAPCGPDRNVSFTSETHFWFEYAGGEQFDFAGDDDTWVFVNGKLAIDLGGLHVPKHGTFTLAATGGTATFTSDLQPGGGTVALGLAKGGTYEVVMFQAERNECGSNFRVTLKDFNRPKSTCASTCGDGIVASDEVCDDGKNDGRYGGCQPGCKARGPFCGDGHVDAGSGEQCDDGNTDNNDACSNTCRVTTVN